MPNFRSLLGAAVSYVRDNPDEIVRTVINAAGLRLSVPIAVLRWAASQAKPGSKAPQDIEVGSTPPALRLSATVDAMGIPIRASGAIRVDEISVTEDAIVVGIRLNDVKLKLLGESDSHLALLIKSGALDLSKPGNLVKFLPKRPAVIVDADGDRIVVDLLKLPALARNGALRRALSIVTPILGIRGIETDGDHLSVAFRATPGGALKALAAFRNR
jgi:hypothetical protein